MEVGVLTLEDSFGVVWDLDKVVVDANCCPLTKCFLKKTSFLFLVFFFVFFSNHLIVGTNYRLITKFFFQLCTKLPKHTMMALVLK